MAVPGANAQVAMGQDLQEINTGSLGFKTIAGDVKLQLPIKWNPDSLPPTSSSLLSVSSSRGLLAAAGEEGLFLASTDNIRAAFTKAKSKDEVVQIAPDFALPLPRLSHVCFTSDGSCLVLAAEQGGGLAIHSTQSLMSKEAKPVFELPTEGISVRALVPNPELPHLVAAVLSNGHLMIANLQERAFARAHDGSASFKNNVICVAWSVRGKQLVAGLQDGTAVQLDPTGIVKAVIPRAPDAEQSQTITSIVWLGNDDFFLVYSAFSQEPDTSTDSFFYWLRTDKGRTKFEFRKAQDPSFPIHARVPVTHFVARIRKWSKLEDIIFTASTVSADVGTVTNSESALTSATEESDITNTYTVTIMEEDSRRATLPMSLNKDDMADTFPIGMALDLTSKDKVYQPIPGDDTITGDSPNPLPAVLVLNQEGILSYWWFVNDAAVRKGEPCPGLIAVEGPSQPAAVIQNTPVVTSPQPAPSPFAAPKLDLGGFAKPAQPAFGQSAFGQSSFGQNKPAPAFGGTSSLGSSQSPWTTGAKPAAPSFGQSSFGTPSSIGASSFGATGGLGQKPSPWGSTSANQTSQTPASPFGSMAGTTSGFARLGQSTASPFGGLGGGAASASPFAQSTPTFGNTPLQSFGSTVSIDSNTGGSTITNKSVFGSGSFPSLTSTPQTSSIFKVVDQNTANSNETPSPFATPFKLNSTFAPASSAKELDMEDEPPKQSGFGLDLGSLSTNLSTPTIKEDPEAPKKGLFDFPSLSENKTPISQASSDFKNEPDETPTPDIKESIEHEQQSAPEPPQVTSKPIPSPLTTASSSATNSLQSSAAIEQGQPVPQLPPSPSEASEEVDPEEEDEREDGEEDDEDEHESPQSPQISEPPSEASTPQRPELESPELTAQSILGSAPASSWKSQFTRTPLVSSPLAPKTVAGLRNEQTIEYGSSPGIPPPAPTPPVAGGLPRPGGLFGTVLNKNSTTPQGLPQPQFKFPPPTQHESPRSPSPVRQLINGNGIPNKPIQVTKQPEPEEEEDTQALVIPPTAEAFLSSIRDQKHELIQETVLARPPTPVLELPPFKTTQREHGEPIHTATTGGEPDNLAFNIERVYKDVNSMIDTLGLNARALAGFIKGHEVFAEDDKENGIDRTEELLRSLDMSDDEELTEHDVEFCLDDLEKFPMFESKLDERLTNERTSGLFKIIGEAGTVSGETRVLKSDIKKMRTFLIAKRQELAMKGKDSPTKLRKTGALAPLPMDPSWATLQRNLRTRLATLRGLLADAEEGITVTRAKVASKAVNGKARGPTVEAVEATVRRMTAMAEKRSGDIDVLEMQMKKLGLIGANGAKGKAAWKRGSVRQENSSVGKTFGLDESDDEDKELSVEELEMRERVRRCVDVRRRRKDVLGHLRDGIWRAQGLAS